MISFNLIYFLTNLLMSSFSNHAPLKFIAQADTKPSVVKLFRQCHMARHVSPPSTQHIASVKTSFNLDSDEKSASLIISVKELIKLSLYDTDLPMSDFVSTHLSPNLDARVCKLILSILENCSTEWREASVLGRVGLPKLCESSWRVDVEGETSGTSNSDCGKQPKVVVDMGVQDHAKFAGKMEGIRHFHFELNKPGLEIMLEGLNKIRVQLKSVV